MKTIDDLRALLPKLVELFSKEDHLVGSTYWEDDEDGGGKCTEYEMNNFFYEEDGWCIEIHYECTGEYSDDPGDYWTPPCYDLNKAWGHVTDMSAYHCDEETNEETFFPEEDLEEFWDIFNEQLEDIA